MNVKNFQLLRTFIILTALVSAGFAYSQSTLPDSTTAGWATADPGYTYGANGRDITSGVRYYYVQNKQIIANISTVDLNNNTVGGIHKGVPMDLIRKSKNRDNIDWAQLVIHKSLLADWDYSSKNIKLDSIWVAGNDSSIFSYGASTELSKIKVKANYSVLPNAPVLKVKLKLFNKDTSAFKGYVEYQMDPDETNNQRGWIPGLGDAPGLVNTAGSSNYIYGGSHGKVYSGYPNHGIAWVKNTPVALVGSTIVFGAWFEVNIKKGDSTEVEFYHISEVADSNKHKIAQDCIAEWATKLLSIDKELSSYNRVKGKVEDIHGKAVRNMLVKAKNTKAELIGQALTDSLGNYSLIIPRDVYTFTVTGLGYLTASRSINIAGSADTVLNFTLGENFAITPIQVWAGTGKQLIVPGFVTCGEDDIVLENDKIALGIAVKSQDPQIGYTSKGNPLDIIVKGSENDLIDWLILSKVSYTSDTTEGWWQKHSAIMDSVNVVSNTSSEAKVKATGRLYRKFSKPLLSNEKLEIMGLDSFAFRTDVTITTTYTLKYGDNFVFASTTISNNSSTQGLKAYVGDIMDFDGTGEISYVPGIGEISGDWGKSSNYEFKPNAPWFAQYGSASIAYGIVYEGAMADSMMAYGVKRWMSTKRQITLAPNKSFTMDRYIVAASTIGFSAKSDAIANVYSKIKVNQSGITFNVTHTNSIVSANDTIKITVRVKNTNTTTVSNIRTQIKGGYNVEILGNDSLTVSLKSMDSTDMIYKIVARTGGRAFTSITLQDHLNNNFERRISVFVKGKGWYAGDNHSHSKYSDGVGTIAENVEAGYAKGLAFLTATDHNTLNQKADVDFQDAKYADMIIMTGEEVTTSKGHCLAYNTSSLIPWNLSLFTQQQIIDSTNRSSTIYGKGFMYLAHPHYPGLPWQDYGVRRQTGLEVWNGFYHATHSVNTLTFKDWDSLNVLGLRLFGISNSDAHNPAVVGKNYIMAYLEDFTKEEIIKSMRDKGNYFGTNGPLLNFTMEGKMMGANIKSSSSGRNIKIDLEGNSNGNTLITEMRVLKNGKIIKSWNPNAMKASYQMTDNGKPGDFYRLELVSGSNGYAFSNPIWVVKGQANANLSKLNVNGNLVSGFDSAKYTYFVKVPNASFTIQGIPVDTNAIVTVQKPVNIASMSASDRTATITVLADDKVATKVYTIVFDRLRKSNANLKSLSVNQALLTGFDSTTLNYTYTPKTSTVNIQAIAVDSNATVALVNPVNISSASIADRTAKITVLADDNVATKMYTIVFDRLLKSNANLKSLSVNSTLVAGFDSTVINYNQNIQNPNFTIQAVPADTNATFTITYPKNIASPSVLDRIGTIKVIADNKVTTKIYSILFERLKRSNANLKSLSINQTLITGFDSLITSYTKIVKDSTFTIQAIASDPNAIVSVKRPINIYSANSSDRKAIIKVTADNQTTLKNYEILFDVQTSVNQLHYNKGITLFPVPASDLLYIQLNEPNSMSSFQIFNMQGMAVVKGKINGKTTEVSLSECSMGVHYIEFMTRDNGKVFEKIMIIK